MEADKYRRPALPAASLVTADVHWYSLTLARVHLGTSINRQQGAHLLVLLPSIVAPANCTQTRDSRLAPAPLLSPAPSRPNCIYLIELWPVSEKGDDDDDDEADDD